MKGATSWPCDSVPPRERFKYQRAPGQKRIEDGSTATRFASDERHRLGIIHVVWEDRCQERREKWCRIREIEEKARKDRKAPKWPNSWSVESPWRYRLDQGEAERHLDGHEAGKRADNWWLLLLGSFVWRLTRLSRIFGTCTTLGSQGKYACNYFARFEREHCQSEPSLAAWEEFNVWLAGQLSFR